jgi:hypothetical protein
MGFGFQQSREAGAPYIPSRSNQQINLGLLVNSYPEVEEDVRRWVIAGRRADSIIYDLRVTGRAGKFLLVCWKDAARKVWVDTVFSDNEMSLSAKAEQGLRLGLLKCCMLWRFDNDLQQWQAIRTFALDNSPPDTPHSIA